MVKNLPAMWEMTRVQSLGWQDPLQEVFSSILAWRTPWAEEPGSLQSLGLHRVGHGWSDYAAAEAGPGGEGDVQRAREQLS